MTVSGSDGGVLLMSNYGGWQICVWRVATDPVIHSEASTVLLFNS